VDEILSTGRDHILGIRGGRRKKVQHRALLEVLYLVYRLRN